MHCAYKFWQRTFLNKLWKRTLKYYRVCPEVWYVYIRYDRLGSVEFHATRNDQTMNNLKVQFPCHNNHAMMIWQVITLLTIASLIFLNTIQCIRIYALLVCATPASRHLFNIYCSYSDWYFVPHIIKHMIRGDSTYRQGYFIKWNFSFKNHFKILVALDIYVPNLQQSLSAAVCFLHFMHA